MRITKILLLGELRVLINISGQNYKLETMITTKGQKLYAIYYYGTSNCWFNLSDEFVPACQMYQVLKTLSSYFYNLKAIKPLSTEQKKFISTRLDDDSIDFVNTSDEYCRIMNEGGPKNDRSG